MYKVLCDNALMYDSRIEELALLNPVVTLEENKAGSFSFTIPPKHPMYDAISKRQSLVQVFEDDEEEPLFSGICIEETKDFYKQKTVKCEGELTFFNDSVQRPARYQGKTVRGLLEAYVASHNAQVEEFKHFTVGQVTVADPNDYLYCYTNMESTLQALKEDLVDDLGGFFRIRHEDGVRYIDYLAESPNTNAQNIKIGKNLLDFTTNIDSSEIATAIIPLGCVLEESPVEGLEARLTIESVNNGLDYVYSQEAVDAYGWIYRTVEWDDVTTASALKTKGEQYLSDIQFENMVIQAKAVDLHLTDKEIERFKISDQIRVVSAPHGLNRYFRLTKQTIYLNNPEKNTITLGKDERLTLSAKSNQTSEEIKKAIANIVPASSILKSAIENSSQLIKNSMNGYITTVTNEDGSPRELLIMDTDNIETATKVWRWNINGLGYSSTGYNGEYALAMTMDGKIVADFITSGTMLADRIKGGTLVLGGINNQNGSILMCDADGNEIIRFDNSGISGTGTFQTNSDAISARLAQGGLHLYKGEDGHTGSLVTMFDGNYEAYGIGLACREKFLALGYVTDEQKIAMRYILNNGYNFDGRTERHIFIDDMFICGNQTIDGRITLGTADASPPFIWRAALSEYNPCVYMNALWVAGDLLVSGNKNRLVETENHGKVAMNAFETAEAYFADMGSGTIGESGVVTITFDEVFTETIEPDVEYQVFLTRTSQEQAEWVEKKEGCFVVHGEAGATFDWMLCCKQKGYADIRMKTVDVKEPKKEGAK